MIDQLTVRSFKSLEDVTIDLGCVNVFIGANGSGKSNLLEALGVLSASADGRLPDAVLELLKSIEGNDHVEPVAKNALRLIDWADEFGSSATTSMPLSPAAAASQLVVRFRDRFMRKGRNILSGYDVSEGALYVLFLAVLGAHVSAPTLCAVDNADHALNPRLARSLMANLCDWYLESPRPRQILLTTHNPLVLDGLRLQDDRVRLFTVARSNTGRTIVRRVEIDASMRKKAEEGWTLSRLWVMGHLGGMGDVRPVASRAGRRRPHGLLAARPWHEAAHRGASLFRGVSGCLLFPCP